MTSADSNSIHLVNWWHIMRTASAKSTVVDVFLLSTQPCQNYAAHRACVISSASIITYLIVLNDTNICSGHVDR